MLRLPFNLTKSACRRAVQLPHSGLPRQLDWTIRRAVLLARNPRLQQMQQQRALSDSRRSGQPGNSWDDFAKQFRAQAQAWSGQPASSGWFRLNRHQRRLLRRVQFNIVAFAVLAVCLWILVRCALLVLSMIAHCHSLGLSSGS